MDECEKMPNLVDRHRLKDRIIESISKAVKNIQLYNSFQNGEHEQPADVLHNDDWQFCKLVEHLDHAFLHGLRHVTNGYWIVVQEFTHRSTVKEIEQLARVITNLGRSRAWLYQALADHLLESYVRCYIDNARIIKRYYVKDALLLDEQRLQLLLTLSSGLDLINFELEIDMPYLDLCSHQTISVNPNPDEETDSADDVSIHSISSSQSSVSILLETPVKLLSKLRRKDVTAQPNDVVVPFDNVCNRGAVFALPVDDDTSQGQTEVLVEHVRGGGHKAKKRGNSSLTARKSVDINMTADSPGTPESGYRSVLEDSMHISSNGMHESRLDSSGYIQSSQLDPADCVTVHRLQNADSSEHCSPTEAVLVMSDNVSDRLAATSDCSSSKIDHVLVVQQSTSPVPIESSTVRSISEDELLKSILDNHCGLGSAELSKECEAEDLSGIVHSSLPVSDAIVSAVQVATSFKESSDCLIVESTATVSDKLCSLVHSSGLSVHTDCLNHVSSSSSSLHNIFDGLVTSLTASETNQEDETSIYDDAVFSRSNKQSLSEDPLGVHSLNNMEVDYSEARDQDSSCELTSSFQGHHLVSVFDRISRTNSDTFDTSESSHRLSPTLSISSVMSMDVSSHPMEVRLDNNLKLLLMLEVFQFDDEKFIKMFRVSTGHTEGEIKPVFLLVTDLAFYLLVSCINGQTKYNREAVVTYKDLDYISLSLNRQMINIVCRSRHKQYWITTGDEQLTELIVEAIDHGLNLKDPEAPKLSVLTDATMQKISLKKFVAAECQTEMQDVQLHGYFLVYWEDTDSLASRELQVDNGCKEGPLLCKTYNYMFGGGATWSPAYFVLKDGMLYQYESRNDVSSTPLSTIHLRKDDCRGCRRVRNGDRNHCFEILFTNSSPLELSALNATEASEWLQAICSAVSSTKWPHRSKASGCLPCCCLIAETRLFMCHEDVRTNFIRSLSSAAIASLKTVYCDPDVDTYCIVAFDSTSHAKVRHEKWAIYFNVAAEKDRFLTTLKETFNRKVHNPLAIQPVDCALSKRCHRGVTRLGKLRMP